MNTTNELFAGAPRRGHFPLLVLAPTELKVWEFKSYLAIVYRSTSQQTLGGMSWGYYGELCDGRDDPIQIWLSVNYIKNSVWRKNWGRKWSPDVANTNSLTLFLVIWEISQHLLLKLYWLLMKCFKDNNNDGNNHQTKGISDLLTHSLQCSSPARSRFSVTVVVKICQPFLWLLSYDISLTSMQPTLLLLLHS